MDEYKIIAVDFDGTLCYSDWPALGDPNERLISYLRNWRDQGNKLILWTCRAGKALRMPLPGVGSRSNLPEIVEMYGNNSRKISCDYYIDDRSMLPEAVGY